MHNLLTSLFFKITFGVNFAQTAIPDANSVDVETKPEMTEDMTARDVKFGIQIGSDWPKIGQIWDF